MFCCRAVTVTIVFRFAVREGSFLFHVKHNLTLQSKFVLLKFNICFDFHEKYAIL